MKWLLVILAALVGAVVLVWVLGSLLPREHRAASRITLRQPADSVWAVVRNLGALKGTWSEMTAASKVADAEGREVWEETVGGFSMRLIVAESEPPLRLVTQVDSRSGAAFGGRWVYQITPIDGGTAVTVAEEGWIGPPPFRLMSKVMGYHRTVDQYLIALGRHFGESVAPEHV